ncbi:hypothetical protein N2K17_01720 [Klebsiella michiganensis]|uniref:hypothetical protein n=1 Tax=Klebsiella michiganensis TaxID=1134687 RepID=UPI002259D939|nr:hypothetical protein [Klebsiella michiganensis]MCX3078458.1 hypothetical protein [Klebsiella michiganensis]MCY0817749.1 hypothetical protein [Klebsiella michiganensis]
MKTVNELKLQLEVYTTRRQVIDLSYRLMQADNASNEQMIEVTTKELQDAIDREDSEKKKDEVSKS